MLRRILFCIIALAVLSVPVFAQNANNIAFINELADKDKVTMSEGIRFFVMVTENKTESFEKCVGILKNQGLIDADEEMNPNDTLRRGFLALLIAKKLNLGDSLIYNIIGIGRYAYKACIAEDIMHVEGSEFDSLSGGELIEIMTNVSEKIGGE